MSRKIENARTTWYFDRRMKILPCQKLYMIPKLRREGWTFRAIARKYKVCHRMIIFICDPLKLEDNQAKRKERIRNGGTDKCYKPTKEYRNKIWLK